MECNLLRIDHFWRKIHEIKSNESNELKYPLVSKIAFSFSHGNSDVERGFSNSGNILTDENTHMKIKMLNSRLNIQEALKTCNNEHQKILITRKLLDLGFSASRKYKENLEKEKKNRLLREAEEKERLESKKNRKEVNVQRISLKRSIDELGSALKG